MRGLVASLILGLFGAASAHAAEPPRDAEIQRMMAHEGIPGLQAAVVKDGRVLWVKSYGSAVLDVPGPARAMSDDMMLFTASIAKLIVTISVFQQLEQGHLALDDDIDRYVPFVIRHPKWPDVPITWRMLLSHTAGFAEEPDERVNRFSFFGVDPDISLEAFTEGTFTRGGVYFWEGLFTASKPGTERIYSNYAYMLMGYAVARMTHQSFDRYAQEHVLDPLKMKHSSYWVAGHTPAQFGVGYTPLREKNGRYRFVPAFEKQAAPGHAGPILGAQLTCPDYPDGCMRSTASDFARLLLMIMGGGALEGAKVLEPGSVKQMITPTGFRNHDGWTQGLGIMGPEDLRGRQVWGHDGQEHGASTAMFFNPKTGVGAVAFANAMDAGWTLNYVLDDLDLHLMAAFE